MGFVGFAVVFRGVLFDDCGGCCFGTLILFVLFCWVAVWLLVDC